MSTQHQPTSDDDATDEDMPSLQSVTDSSDSEDDLILQQSLATGRRGIISPSVSYRVNDVSNQSFTRGHMQQSTQFAGQFPDIPGQPGRNGAGHWPYDPLQSASLSHTIDHQDVGGTNGTSPHFFLDGDRTLSHLRRLSRRYDKRVPDHSRADVLIDGLESVSRDLLSRYGVVRGEDRPLCGVCSERLDQDSPYQTENRKRLRAPTFSEVVALPCVHIFHSECLSPWFARQTTCPMCRFDVDPESLTLGGGGGTRPWVPPAKGVLEALVHAEEKKRTPSLHQEKPDTSFQVDEQQASSGIAGEV